MNQKEIRRQGSGSRSIDIFFFQAEDGIRDSSVLEFRRVLFRSKTVQSQSSIEQTSIGQSSTTQFSTVQSRSRAYSTGWLFHARQNEYRKTALDCSPDTLPESPARAQISAACPPENVAQRFPSGLRLLGVRGIYRL